MTKGRWWIGVTAGVAVGLGAVVATEAATDTATAQTARQAGFTRRRGHRGKLETSVREGQPRWAVVEAGSGSLARAKGATASAKLAAVGDYTVTFDRDVSACSIQASVAGPGTAAPPRGEVVAWRSADNPQVVNVRTFDPTATPAETNAVPFHVAVLC